MQDCPGPIREGLRLASPRAGRSRQIGAHSPACRISSVQHETCNAARIPDRVLDGNGTALGNPQERKPFDSGRIDDRFQVANKCVEGNLLNVPIRQTVGPRVIADKTVIPCQPTKDVSPNGTVPIVFEMVEPVRCLYERRSLTHSCIRNANPVGCRTESNLLLETFVGPTVHNGCLDPGASRGESLGQDFDVPGADAAELLHADLMLALSFLPVTGGGQDSDQRRMR